MGSEGTFLCDAQGKLASIGDCAPLSFQTVRRPVTTTVDAHAFAPETSGYIALEKIHSCAVASATYLDVTAGLIDLLDNSRLVVTLPTRPPK